MMFLPKVAYKIQPLGSGFHGKCSGHIFDKHSLNDLKAEFFISLLWKQGFIQACLYTLSPNYNCFFSRSLVDLPQSNAGQTIVSTDFSQQYLKPLITGKDGNLVVFLQDKVWILNIELLFTAFVSCLSKKSCAYLCVPKKRGNA